MDGSRQRQSTGAATVGGAVRFSPIQLGPKGLLNGLGGAGDGLPGLEGEVRRLRHRRAQDAGSAERLSRLTPRELEILQLMAEGRSPEAISATLGVTPATLRTHTQNLITRLGVHSKMEALVLAIRHGTVTTVDVTETDTETDITVDTDTETAVTN